MEFKDILIVLTTALVLFVLLIPKVRNNSFWQATVTPLASIIGSGFLIAAPVLGQSVGTAAPYAMIGIAVFAYLIGSVIRFNIGYAEPLLEKRKQAGVIFQVEQLSNSAVFFAYLISVAFYLRLMSAFILNVFDAESDFLADILTTAVLALIGVIGIFKGLKFLEVLEEYSVSIKLSIIAALFMGLIYFQGFNTDALPKILDKPFNWDTMGLLAGMLLVVQGFETSRFLGDQYTRKTRIISMRLSQIFSGFIYIAFAFLILPLLGFIEGEEISETAIIDLSEHVSFVLPVMLAVAAVASQFSAAIADTLGGGGLIKEETKGKLPVGVGYSIIVVGAIALVWSANIFEIIVYASKAFAFYYLTQTIVAFFAAKHSLLGVKKYAHQGFFILMMLILIWIVIFAKAVE